MAIDSITISIDHIHEVDRFRYYSYKEHQQLPLSELNSYPFINYGKLKFYKYKNRYSSRYEKHVNEIHFSYYPFLHKGYIEIKFNLAKLLYGCNIPSIYQFNLQTLWETLCCKLKDLIDLTRYPFIYFWKVNYYENNFDIIDIVENNSARYDVLRKTSVNNLNLDDTYADNGSLYFTPRNLKSSYKIIIYNKLKELKDKDLLSNSTLTAVNSLFSITPAQDILRVEIKQNRDKIVRDFKHTKSMIITTDSTANYFAHPMSQYIGSFGEIIDFNYQIKQLEYMIKILSLDKRILTKDKLFNLINSDYNISPTTKKNIIRMIRYLNGEIKNLKLSKKTMQIYKNIILNKGYHYIYSNIELDPISLDNIISNLPTSQVDNINRYKSRSIFHSFLF